MIPTKNSILGTDRAIPAAKVRDNFSKRSRWPLAFRFALRDFRGGLQGFGIFLGCIALGVAAIIGVGSVSLSLKDGLAREGRNILGGDVSFNLAQRELSDPEHAFLSGQGRLSSVALLRAMARRDDGEAALVEVKAADRSYPLAGNVLLDPALPLADALAEHEGVFGIAADPALFGRLNLSLGNRLTIGTTHFEVRARLLTEPDRLAGGIGLGPPLLLSQEALRASGLIQPGALIRWLNRVTLDGTPASDEHVAALIKETKQKFPEAGWEIRSRDNISPQFSRNLDRFTEFLTLMGLTSLVVGGVGVANAVRGFVERKRQTIAALKALGATGSTVFLLMLTQTMLVASAGVILGAAVGAGIPYAAAFVFGSMIPFPLAPAIYPAAVGKGLLYGFLTALAFSAGPLGRAHDLPVQALSRAEVDPQAANLRPRYIILTLAAAFCLALAVLGFATDTWLAFIYMGSTLAAFAALRSVSFLIVAGAKRAPRVQGIALRLAIGNIHRPGALTTSVVLSLGLGLALLVALTLIDSNIRAELDQSVPRKSPSFFFVDVQSAKAGEFASFLKSRAPDGTVELVPMMRGRIVKLNGTPASAVRPKQNVAWVLDGDRGVTFSQSVPEGSRVVKGSWWPKDYAGPPLVSLDDEIADGLGLTTGDEVTVNVLGRDITAKIANTRKINWHNYGINFILVFTPNSLAGAPFSDLATLTFADGSDPVREVALLRETAQSFPSVTSVRVKDALDAVNAVAGQLALAIRGAASVTFLASILVLGGALAAGQHARVHDAAVLKTLGATRARLLKAYIYEYALIGLCTAVFGVAAGGVAAYEIVRRVMELDFIWLWPQAIAAAAIAIAATVILGLLGTYRILGRKPASYLRDL